eukprot:Amastigsp_a680968_5.p3 type:complete len:108 gc:universal Amastigsp_a680968_5:323-646(+)
MRESMAMITGSFRHAVDVQCAVHEVRYAEYVSLNSPSRLRSVRPTLASSTMPLGLNSIESSLSRCSASSAEKNESTMTMIGSVLRTVTLNRPTSCGLRYGLSTGGPR